MSDLVGGIIVIGVSCIIVAEIYLSTTWKPFYFQYGLPVFVKNYHIDKPVKFSYYTRELESYFQKKFRCPLQFVILNPDQCAIRERSSYVYSTKKVGPLTLRTRSGTGSMLHGLLYQQLTRQKLTIVAYLNWYVILIWIGAIVASIVDKSFSRFLIVSLFLGLFVLLSTIRYAQVCDWLDQRFDAY